MNSKTRLACFPSWLYEVLTWSLVCIVILIVGSSSAIAQPRPFITTWKTDNPGESCNSCLLVPASTRGFMFDVDWENDGVYDDFDVTNDIEHDYGQAGTYQVAIRGMYPRIRIEDREKLLSVDQWGDQQLLSIDFDRCFNLDVKADDAPDLSEVTSLGVCFADCYSLTGGLSSWDVSNVRDFNAMFAGCVSYNEDLDSWDMRNASSLGGMFQGAKVFNGDVTTWQLDNANHMESMFVFCDSFNVDISGWDMSNVQFIGGMFSRTKSFNQPIGRWDVSNVRAINGIFSHTEAFNQDLSNWDVRNVDNCGAAFNDAKAFDQDLGSWHLENATFFRLMFSRSGMSCENYSNTLIGWAGKDYETTARTELDASDMIYNQEAASARSALIQKGWEFVGDSYGECLTSTDDEVLQGLNIYPNPTYDNIYLDNKAITVQVLNVNGAVVAVQYDTTTVDLSDLPSGIYLLDIRLKSESRVVEKVVKL